MNEEIFQIHKDDFPQKLLEIPQPPKQLFIKGKTPDWNNSKFVTVVGSKKYSNYGKEACERMFSYNKRT